MRTLRNICLIIIIGILVFIAAFIISIVGIGQTEDVIVYHLTVYDAETNEMLEDWESHHITVEETDEYVDFYCIRDDGGISYRHMIKQNRKIKYTFTQEKEAKHGKKGN